MSAPHAAVKTPRLGRILGLPAVLNGLALLGLLNWPVSEWRADRISEGVLHYWLESWYTDSWTAGMAMPWSDQRTGMLAVSALWLFFALLNSIKSPLRTLASVGLLWTPLLVITLLSGDVATTTRISLSSGFWAFAALTSVAALTGVAGQLKPLQQAALVVVAVGVLGYGLSHELWSHLSVVREWRAQEDLFARAVWEHVCLATTTTVAAAVVAIPLAMWLYRYPTNLGLVLHFIHTIPSLALFGLLMLPLAMLAHAVPTLADWGVHGIGVAPAWCALFLYGLLPMYTTTVNGLQNIDPAVIEAARGMGLNAWQRLWSIELPLARASLIGAVSVTLVQLMGLATIAALIGGGGLGTLVFNGIGQNAPDLVLLGTLAIVFLSLVVQFLLPLPPHSRPVPEIDSRAHIEQR